MVRTSFFVYVVGPNENKMSCRERERRVAAGKKVLAIWKGGRIGRACSRVLAWYHCTQFVYECKHEAMAKFLVH